MRRLLDVTQLYDVLYDRALFLATAIFSEFSEHVNPTLPEFLFVVVFSEFSGHVVLTQYFAGISFFFVFVSCFSSCLGHVFVVR